MSSLPGLLGDIADIVGPEIALEIARSHGGTRISLPTSGEAGHWLTELVGLETADKICRALATTDADGKLRGVTHEILPLGPASLVKRAKLRAQALLDEGKSVREVARETGLHERTVWRMKGEDDRQGRLF